MSAPLNKRLMTAEEYLAFERASDTKHEFFDGELIDFAYSDIGHAQLVHNISSLLYTQRRLQGCLTFTSTLRLRIGKARVFTYPDVIVTCEAFQFADEQEDTVLNPTIIFEVLSPSTEVHDRVRKFTNYTMLPSLQAYLLVTQDHPQIEEYTRQPDGSWLYLKVTSLADQITLPAANCTLRLEEIYENVSLNLDQSEANA